MLVFIKIHTCFSSAAACSGGSVLNVAALLASGTQVTPQIAMAARDGDLIVTLAEPE